MENLTKPNFKKEPNQNDESCRQGHNPVPQKSRKKDEITTVMKVENKSSDAQLNNPSCSSTPVKKRRAKTKETFNQLTQNSRFMRIEEEADRYSTEYNGRVHSQYSLSIKDFTCGNKNPLSFFQKNKLLPRLITHYPTDQWNWRSLSTSFYSWYMVDLFTANNNFCQQAKKVQKNLLDAFLFQILHRHNEDHLLPDLTCQCLANLLGSIAKLVNQGMSLETPKLKETVIVLWRHVAIMNQSPENYFTNHAAVNLLWGMTKLCVKGLKAEKIPGLQRSVLILWDLVVTLDVFTCPSLSNLAWSFAKLMKFKLMEDIQNFNTLVASLFFLIDEQKDQFLTRDLSSILYSIGEIGELGKLRLDQKHTNKLKDTAATLLPIIVTKFKSKEDYDFYDAQQASSMLSTITKLLELDLMKDTQKDTSELNQSLDTLFPLTAKLSHLLSPQILSTVMIAIVKLKDRNLSTANIQQIKNIAITLLPLVITKIKHLNPLGIVNMIHSIAKLVECKLLKVTPTLNQSMALLLPLVTEQNDPFTTKNLIKLISAVASLWQNGIDQENRRNIHKIVFMLLPLLEIKVESKAPFKAKETATMLSAIATLMDGGLQLNTQRLSKFMTLLLPLIVEQKDNFTPSMLAYVLWSITKLSKFVLNRKNAHKFKAVVVPLLSVVLIKCESKKETDHFTPFGIAILLWVIATLLNNNLKLDTPTLKKFVTTLLCHVASNKNQFTHRSIANILWSISALGELIEIKIAVTLSVSLLNVLDQYNELNNKEKMMSLWGILTCIARARLLFSDSADEIVILQTHIQQLFDHMKKTPLETDDNKTTMTMVAAWLGEPYLLCPTYHTTTSDYQEAICKALSEKHPSLSIEKEKSIFNLPPTDIYLPAHNIVIEIQGHHHYVSNDLKTRNGSTLLKIALLEKMGCDVIEISTGNETISIQEQIQKIEKKINSSKKLSLKATDIPSKREEKKGRNSH